MAPKPKGVQSRSRSRPRKETGHISRLTPLVPIDKARTAAAKLRPLHPTLDDDTAALCILHVSTRLSIKAIAKQLGAAHSWCYARIARPDVQAFLQQLANTLLGVAAARSITTLQDLAENSIDESMRHRASVELLDRAGLGNTSAQRSAGVSQPYAFSFAPVAQQPLQVQGAAGSHETKADGTR